MRRTSRAIAQRQSASIAKRPRRCVIACPSTARSLLGPGAAAPNHLKFGAQRELRGFRVWLSHCVDERLITQGSVPTRWDEREFQQGRFAAKQRGRETLQEIVKKVEEHESYFEQGRLQGAHVALARAQPTSTRQSGRATEQVASQRLPKRPYLLSLAPSLSDQGERAAGAGVRRKGRGARGEGVSTGEPNPPIAGAEGVPATHAIFKQIAVVEETGMASTWGRGYLLLGRCFFLMWLGGGGRRGPPAPQ